MPAMIELYSSKIASGASVRSGFLKWKYFPALRTLLSRCPNLHSHIGTPTGMSTILPLFWDLSSSDKKKRLDTSVELVATLQKLQATFENESAEPDEPSGESLGVDGHPRDCSAEDVEEHNFRLDVLNSPDVAYSIRRLLRGLASPRESSRLGFAVALTEVCTTLRSHYQSAIKLPRASFPCLDCFLLTNPCARPRRVPYNGQPNWPRRT